jgi:hypothetical protein
MRQPRWIQAVLFAVLGLVVGDETLGQRPEAGVRSGAASKPGKSRTATYDEAIELIQEAQQRFRSVKDYSCVFVKQEKLEGRLQPPEYIEMKVRNEPFSVYMNWLEPNAGRELIYVHGRNNNMILAHEGGGLRSLAGTVELEPTSERAMSAARYPITSAGIGNLIKRLLDRWGKERDAEGVEVKIAESVKVDGQECMGIQIVRPNDPRRFRYYRDVVYISKKTGLPTRFEGFGWPRSGGSPKGDPLEVYTYRDLQPNLQMTSRDFSTDNPSYNFGRL